MDHHANKSTGVSLISGSLLIIATMVLHPAGGSLEHIVEISGIITISHAMAIACLPLVAFGFYGLSYRLQDKWRLSHLAFLIILFGLIAAMFAALVNGLTLPYFLGQYADSLSENSEVLQPIVNYGFSLNKPLDYIFITACCVAVCIYSVIMIRTGQLPKWIGYLGALIVLFALTGALTDFVFTSLQGFRIFTFSLAGWILATGFSMTRTNQGNHE